MPVIFIRQFRFGKALGIEIAEDEAETLNAADVRAVVDYITGKLGL